MSPATRLSASRGVQPRRRIVKRVALLAAVPLLLLSAYVCSWLLFTGWAASGGALPPGQYVDFGYTGGAVVASHWVFEPIHRYIVAGLPGGRLLAAMRNEVIQRSLPPPFPPPEPQSPVIEEIDRLLREVPQ